MLYLALKNSRGITVYIQDNSTNYEWILKKESRVEHVTPCLALPCLGGGQALTPAQR